MLRVLLLVLLMLSAGVGLSLLSGEDSGYLLLAWSNWRIEVHNLVIAFALLLTLFLMVHWLLNSFASLQRGRTRWRRWRIARNDLGGERVLLNGLRLLAEGRWQKAEQKLLRAANRSRTPLLGYLGAAQAANQLGDADGRDRYLAAASRGVDSSAVAIGLLRAKSLQSNGQVEEAVSVLEKLLDADPGHPQVLNALQQSYLDAQCWRKLLDLLPRLRRQKLIGRDQAAALSRQCHLELLRDADSLHEGWRQLPKKLTQDAEMLALYLPVLVADGQADRAFDLVQRLLDSQLDGPLLDWFGRVNSAQPSRQLTRVEKWLLKNPTNPDLLLAAARIAVRCERVPRAIDYYEALVAVRPQPIVCQELGELLVQQQRPDAAIKYFQQGLGLAL